MKAISILSIGALAAVIAGCLNTEHSASATGERYPWKKNIVTTVFWIGEKPSGNNPVPNRRSSWDKDWTRNYGGFDDPNPAHRSNYIPVKFTPRQNPFYCALPYNDKTANGHRPEAPRVSFRGSRKRTKAPAFPPARIDGSRFARGIERFMRNGKTQDLSAPIIGNMSLATTVRNPI
jgi:hypothetical protein